MEGRAAKLGRGPLLLSFASVFLLEVAGAQLSEVFRAFLGVYRGIQRAGW